MTKDITIRPRDSAVPSGVAELLDEIRPQWKDKGLIQRVTQLIPVDPGAACQKLLNAAIHDLKEKIVIAGLDLAKQAASSEPKLPAVNRKEDVLDSYSTFNVLELAYRIGLLSRPEWKRLKRAYDIRRDLEHEDDEYVASLEDIVYIFKSSIEIVLSREPQELLRVDDVETLIQAPSNVTPSADFLQDYERAPEPRQLEICHYLVRTALDEKAADIVRQNAVEALVCFAPKTLTGVKIELASQMQERTKRKPFTLAEIKIAEAAAFRPYLKQRQLETFFTALIGEFETVGHHWTSYPKHRDVLEKLEDCGGLEAVPVGLHSRFLRWMVLCYIGEPGGYGTWGQNRKVFYSDVASSVIYELLKRAYPLLREELYKLAKNGDIKRACENEHVAARLKRLLKLLDETDESS